MNFIGTYAADRATMTVGALGNDGAEITVEWADGATAGSTWHMTGTFDANTLTVNYNDCTKVDYSYEDEDKRTETVAYTGGQGSITFDGSSSLTWNDGEEHVADGLTFTWVQ